jgi:hypothetical protein
MKTMKRIAPAVALVALALVVAACTPPFIRVQLPAGQRVSVETSTIDAQGVRDARVRLNMGVGELHVSGGAPKLMDGTFDYRPAEWKPRVQYAVEGSTGVLTIDQPAVEHTPAFGDTRNTWDVKLNDQLPIDLDVELGVGESELRLGSLSLRNLAVRGGAGETTIDLTGKPSRDLIANVESGVGELRLRVPRDAGVRITGIRDGIGDWKAEGFTQRAGDDNAVYNAAYHTAQYKYVIHLLRGVGSIRVEQL